MAIEQLYYYVLSIRNRKWYMIGPYPSKKERDAKGIKLFNKKGFIEANSYKRNIKDFKMELKEQYNLGLLKEHVNQYPRFKIIVY
jgi:hypothetical protein